MGVDADESLLSFGQTERVARKAYLSAIQFGYRELGRDVQPGSDAPGIWAQADRDLAPDDTGPYVGVLGRSTGLEWRGLSADELISEGAQRLGIDLEDLASRGRRREVVESRRLLLALGRERWGQKATDLGTVLGKKADTISYLACEGIRQRLEDEVFAGRYEALGEAMIGGPW